MAGQRTSRTDVHHDGALRVINEPLDERNSRLVGGISIAGILVGVALGLIVGLLLALLIPAVTWWAGLLVGGLTGSVIGALLTARLGATQIEHDILPPAARPSDGANPRR